MKLSACGSTSTVVCVLFLSSEDVSEAGADEAARAVVHQVVFTLKRLTVESIVNGSSAIFRSHHKMCRFFVHYKHRKHEKCQHVYRTRYLSCIPYRDNLYISCLHDKQDKLFRL